MAIDIQWIYDDDSLVQHCDEWNQLPFVALDTEFMRVDTFYPIAGLIQISDGIRAYLIDPLTIDNWQPLASLMENPDVIKVVHSCSEDLEVLMRLTGSLPVPLFDQLCEPRQCAPVIKLPTPHPITTDSSSMYNRTQHPTTAASHPRHSSSTEGERHVTQGIITLVPERYRGG